MCEPFHDCKLHYLRDGILIIIMKLNNYSKKWND